MSTVAEEGGASPQEKNDPFNVQYWSERWNENKIGFHKIYVNPTLLKYMELVTGQQLGSEPLTDPVKLAANSKLTWFVPLCGKSLDIPYLLTQGFKVFAVEAVKLAIEQLEQEQKLGLTFDEKSSLYTGANGRLRIYRGDFFQFPVEEYGPFDFVWDRGSFIALEYPHRQAYSEVMQRTFKGQNFRYLLETVLYDKDKFEGPPRSVDDADIETYFGPWAKFEFLSEEMPPEDSSIFKRLQLEASLRIFLLTPKSN